MGDGMTFVSHRADRRPQESGVNGSAAADDEVDGEMDERDVERIVTRNLQPIFDRIRELHEAKRDAKNARDSIKERAKDAESDASRALDHAHKAIGEVTTARLAITDVTARLVSFQSRLDEVKTGADPDTVNELKQLVRALSTAITRLETNRDHDKGRADKADEAIGERVTKEDYRLQVASLELAIKERSPKGDVIRLDKRVEKLEAASKRQMWWIVSFLVTIVILLLGVIAKS